MREEKQNPDQYPLGEPSVLDYVKSLLHLGSGERIRIPEEDLSPVIGEQLLEEEPVSISPQVAAVALPAVEAEAIPAVEPELAVQESVPRFTYRAISLAFPAGSLPWPDRPATLRAASYYLSAWICLLHRRVHPFGLGNSPRRVVAPSPASVMQRAMTRKPTDCHS